MDTAVYGKVPSPSRALEEKELVFRKVIDDIFSLWPREEFVRTDSGRSHSRRQYSSTLSKINIRAFDSDEERAIVYFARSAAHIEQTNHLLKYRMVDGIPERYGALESWSDFPARLNPPFSRI